MATGANQLPESLQKIKSEQPEVFQAFADYFIGVGKSESQRQIEAVKKEQEKLLKQLEDSAARLQDGDAEKEKYLNQIRELEGQVLSKEDVLKKTLERTQAEHKKAFEAAQLQAKKEKEMGEAYRQRYENYLVDNTIIAACTRPETKAFNPQHVISSLRSNAKVVPLLDENDKETGEYKVVLALKDEKTNKVRDFEFDEGFKTFYDQKGNANLFESKIGSGSSNGAQRLPGSGNFSAAALQDFGTYVQNREQILQSS